MTEINILSIVYKETHLNLTTRKPADATYIIHMIMNQHYTIVHSNPRVNEYIAITRINRVLFNWAASDITPTRSMLTGSYPSSKV